MGLVNVVRRDVINSYEADLEHSAREIWREKKASDSSRTRCIVSTTGLDLATPDAPIRGFT